MKSEEEIKERYWFLIGKNSALQYVRSYTDYSFAEEINDNELQISVLKWVLDEEQK